MVTKNSQTPLAKKKAAAISGLCQQYVLLDDQGFKPFRPQDDAIPVAPVEGKYKVGGMKILLAPVPKDPVRPLTLVTDNLVLLRQDAMQWADCDGDRAVSLVLDSWTCSKCSVTFRSTEDKGVIRATYSRSDDHLDLSLPCKSSWADYGLGWLLNRDRCCAREAHNPTPWLGKQCGCK